MQGASGCVLITTQEAGLSNTVLPCMATGVSRSSRGLTITTPLPKLWATISPYRKSRAHTCMDTSSYSCPSPSRTAKGPHALSAHTCMDTSSYSCPSPSCTAKGPHAFSAHTCIDTSSYSCPSPSHTAKGPHALSAHTCIDTSSYSSPTLTLTLTLAAPDGAPC